MRAQSFITEPFRLCNTAYDEQAPVISPDQKFLFYTIAKHPDNIGGKKDPGDIWFSTWSNGAWSAPIHAGILLNNEDYNAVLGFSADGSKIFLTGHYEKSGSAKTQGISFANQTEAGWSYPENITVPYFMNRSHQLTGMITPDETVFIFSADSYGTKGVEDIYVSLKKDGNWGEPINLGATINTSLQEVTPAISADGKTIYFSSNGRGGAGGFDIFKSERLDDSWMSWSTPQNLEGAINTEARELFYRPDFKLNIFLCTTTKNSNGYGNIFAIGESLNIQPPKDSTNYSKQQNTEGVLKNNRVMLSGRVVNLKTNAGLVAEINFKSDSTYSVRSDAQGNYKVIIPANKVYGIIVKAKNYVNLSERLDIHTFELRNLEMNFKLQPIEVGTVVNLKSVLFYMGTTSLLEESYPELDVVTDFLKSNPKVEIQLEGHTDNRGDAKKNLILSQQRVDRIKSYLVSKGIGAKRIKGKGFGGSKPIATSDTEEARKLNRRVEFVIVKD
jgi:outer membrane protein OmpA-like peptidoglycan-associated protein